MSSPVLAPRGPLCDGAAKGLQMALVERDAGFCSGGDDEDAEVEDDLHSPTDVSEDSVEVKVLPISLRNKNKRKCAEPRKVSNEDAPYKKRRHFEAKKARQQGEDATETATSSSPFRPWSHPVGPEHPRLAELPRCCPSADAPSLYTERVPALHEQEEPLSLVLKAAHRRRPRRPDPGGAGYPDAPSEDREVEDLSRSQPRTKFSVESLLGGGEPRPGPSSIPSTSSDGKKPGGSPSGQQRNYKNMTRERRIEANARERTRVHTISAAFDTLRRAIPAYSHNQKLSKLSVLRIACSYILTLSRVAGSDYSADQSQPSLADCVDLVSRTIQTEGKLRKKKDE